MNIFLSIDIPMKPSLQSYSSLIASIKVFSHFHKNTLDKTFRGLFEKLP